MTDINFQTILADILADINDRGESKRKWQLKRAAVQEFARINGWTIGPKDFPPQAIGNRTRTLHAMQERVFDHCLYFRVKGRNAAIVTQPYPPDCRDQAAALAARLGIELHIPPNPQASIWFPGHAFFFVFTERGHAIQWLPEQMVQA